MVHTIAGNTASDWNTRRNEVKHAFYEPVENSLSFYIIAFYLVLFLGLDMDLVVWIKRLNEWMTKEISIKEHNCDFKMYYIHYNDSNCYATRLLKLTY